MNEGNLVTRKVRKTELHETSEELQSSIGSVTEVAQAVPQTEPSLTEDGKAGALHVGHAPAASEPGWNYTQLFSQGVRVE